MMKTCIALALALLFASPEARARAPWSPQSYLPQSMIFWGRRQGDGLESKVRSKLDRALAYLDLGQYDKALALLDFVLKTSPMCTTALRARARTLLTLGYLQWRRPMVKQAIEDAETFLWIEYEDVAMRDLLVLLRQLDNRMERIESARRKRKAKRGKPGT